MKSKRTRGWWAASVALLLCSPAATRADEVGAFVVRLGNDTLSLEQVTRTESQLRGEYVMRTPRASHRTYTADLDADGNVRRFELVTHNLGPGGPAETRATIEFTGDSAITTAPRGESTVTLRMAAGKGAVPSVQGVMGLIEQLARQARAAGAARYSVAFVTPGSANASQAIVTPGGGDTLRMIVENAVGRHGPWVLRLDARGRLIGFSGPGTPFQAEIERIAAVDFAAARAAYSTRPLGPLSARDTVRADLGDARIWVDYGRPIKRGRVIFGKVVPWNTVWRTGANAATHLHTPVDLTIGGTTVPAGAYTLWTLPSERGWKLIINRQTGQWGTDYDAEQDLARLDVRTEKLARPVEQFTISIEPKGAEAILSMSWDQTRVSVPVRRKG
jgi:hypothetical protein